MATYTFKLNGKQYTSTAAKDDLTRFTSAVNSVVNIQKHCREIRGIVGGESHVSEVWLMFGDDGGGTMADPAGWQRERDALLASIPATIKRADLPGLVARAERILTEYMPVNDLREQPDEHAAKLAENNRIRAEQDAKHAAANRAEAAESAKMRAEYPYLQTPQQTGKNERVTAAQNIRTQLAREFPGVKFTVRGE